MSGSLSVIGIAALAGLAAVFQAQAMGLMNTRLGTLAAVVITYGLGGTVAIAIALVTRSSGLSDWRTIPVWALGAGLAGLVDRLCDPTHRTGGDVHRPRGEPIRLRRRYRPLRMAGSRDQASRPQPSDGNSRSARRYLADPALTPAAA